MDIYQLVEEQMVERYKHFIIFGPALQGKTKIVKLISDKYSGVYIDLLEVFRHNDVFKEQIDIFSPEKLIKYIEETYCQGTKLVVIDHLDFLIHTWDEYQLRELITYIEMGETNYSCLFALQDYKFISQLVLRNDKGNSRNINVFDISRGND